jgi:hypothetical protein
MSTPTTPSSSPSPAREVSLVTSPEQFDQFCMKAFLKVSKTQSNSPIINVSYLNKDGTPRKEVSVNMAPIDVQGITMPFIRLTPDGKGHDVGVSMPQIKIALKAGTPERALFRADFDKINDALFTYVYGLDTKPVIRVERVPVKDMEDTFSPLIHYADGTKLAVRKADIVNEIKNNPLQYLEIPRKGDDVYFKEKAPDIFKGINDETLYVEIDLKCPGGFTMRRKNKVEPTADQMNIDKWGVQIYEMKLGEGGWVALQENIANRLPQIKSPNGRGAFVGYVIFRPSYITAGAKPKLHFEGAVGYVGPLDTNDIPVPFGEFQSSLPVQPKKLKSKAALSAAPAAAAAKTGKEEESEDEGEFG